MPPGRRGEPFGVRALNLLIRGRANGAQGSSIDYLEAFTADLCVHPSDGVEQAAAAGHRSSAASAGPGGG